LTWDSKRKKHGIAPPSQTPMPPGQPRQPLAKDSITLITLGFRLWKQTMNDLPVKSREQNSIK
jgi:hypothetical protein